MKEEIPTEDAKVSAYTLDDHSFVIYEWVACEVHATDSWEIKHDSQQSFLITDIVYYDAILRWSWLTHENSDCDWLRAK